VAQIDYSVLREEFGLPYQLIVSVPELRRIADRMVNEDWDVSRVKNAIEGTDWWRSNSEKQRQYLVKSIMDPATIRQDIDSQKYKIASLISDLGYPGDNLIGSDWVDQMAYNVLYNGWDEARLKYEVGVAIGASGNIRTVEGTLGGKGGEFEQNMRQLAYQNGIELDEEWYNRYYSGILKGTSTVEQAQRDIRNQAAAKYSGFAEQIQAGQNVMDIASPYMQSMGNILEINSKELNLFDPTVTSALNYRDNKGNVGSKPLWQFENDLRKDPRWLQTNNAREGLMTVAHKVAQDMGVAY
jgi:hypothetical protein